MNNRYNKKFLAASIYIYDDEITAGYSKSGKFYYTITASNGAAWDEYSLDISNDLPIKASTVILPELPNVIVNYSGTRKKTAVKITEITYTIDDDDLYIYFSGEKTYDISGSGYSRAVQVGWKLYDSEGYIVDSGTFYSPAIAVGEKFRNEKQTIWNIIKPGETYTLVISNTD